MRPPPARRPRHLGLDRRQTRRGPAVLAGAAVAVALLALPGSTSAAGPSPDPARCVDGLPSDLAGRYAADPFSLVLVERRGSSLVLRPFHWQSPQVLEPRGGGEYGVQGRAERSATFDCAAGPRLTLAGFGEEDGGYVQVDEGRPTALEDLLAGRVDDARRKLAAEPDGLRRAGELVLAAYPSAARHVVALFTGAGSTAGPGPAALPVIADAYLLAGEPEAARAVLAVAPPGLEAEPEAEAIRAARERLVEPDGDLGLGFSLRALFAPPTAGEIAAVRSEWASRDLSPRDVEIVEELLVPRDGAPPLRARLIRHLVHGRVHHGVILLPPTAEPGCCPGVLETKGVAWYYPELTVPDGLHTPIVLDGLLDRFVILVPGLPGEVLRIAGRELRSEGEPNDAFDGATDAALAFLRAAKTVTPELRGDRVCAFGKSRGGTVSLLAGIRDPEIACVVDWAGPVDWFEHMGKGGLTLWHLVARALADRSPPSAGQGGQFVDWFLRSREVPLAALRRWVLAGSPLFFAEALPPTQAHYGVEDRFVPIGNGEALAGRLLAAGRGWPTAEVVTYERLGHDLDPLEAVRRTREFLVGHLLEAP